MIRVLPLVALLALLAPGPARAHAPESMRAFGDALLQEGDAYRAIGAYKAYLFLAPEAPDRDLVRYRIALAYQVGGEHDAAWHDARQVDGRPEVEHAARLLAARAAFDAGRFVLAADALGDAPGGWAGELRGWSLLHLDRPSEASTAFRAAGTRAGRALAERLDPPPRLPSRSPALAGFLALIPGLGHLYAGLPEMAVAAFVWNGAFAYGLYESARREAWGLFAVLAVLESLFYGGNVYGAVTAAQRFRRDARRAFLEELAALHPPPGPPPEPDLPEAPPLGIGLRLSLP